MNAIKQLGLPQKLILAVFSIGLLLAATMALYQTWARDRAVESAGLNTASAVANQVATLRVFYTTEIAPRAKKAGMQLDHEFAAKEGALPVPATLVKALGESIAQKYPGTHVRLASKYPFPQRVAAGAKLDEFQAQALAKLEADPKTPVHSVETFDGRLSVRYAVADVMAEGCVACHNSHAQSPKKDWKVGDVRGILEVVVPVTEVDANARNSAAMALLLIVLAFGGLGGACWVLVQRLVARPLQGAGAAVETLASGDLTQPIDTRGGAEIGQLLRSLETLRTQLQRTLGGVRSAVDSISTASSEIATGTQDLSQRTEQTASNLQETAASMAQLTDTVRQSADSARQANQLAGSAADVAQRGGAVVSQVVATMDEINASSKKIADIVGTIDGIAFQTNILALNAAVEAARAGEQGRGFAVVASEVRSLAQRSAEAAREIKSLIGSSVEKVETGSRLVSDAGSTMDEIVASVRRVSDIIGEISAASAEQSGGIGQVNAAVSQLEQMTQQNAALVEQSTAAAESLKSQSQQLAQAVAGFRTGNSAAPTGPSGHGHGSIATHTAPKALASSAIQRARSPAPGRVAPVAPAKPAAKRDAAPQAAPLVTAPAAAPASAPVSASASTSSNDDWETF